MNGKLSLRFLAVIFVLGSSILLRADPVAAQAGKIKMANGSSPPILDSITPYVAVEAGIFKKYGLDVEMVEFRGDMVEAIRVKIPRKIKAEATETNPPPIEDDEVPF